MDMAYQRSLRSGDTLIYDQIGIGRGYWRWRHFNQFSTWILDVKKCPGTAAKPFTAGHWNGVYTLRLRGKEPNKVHHIHPTSKIYIIQLLPAPTLHKPPFPPHIRNSLLQSFIRQPSHPLPRHPNLPLSYPTILKRPPPPSFPSHKTIL